MQLAGAFRHSDSVVAILGVDDGNFLDVNPAFERWLGWTREEVLGKRTLDIDLWPELEVRAAIWGQLRTRASVRGMALRARTRTGEILACTLDCEMMDYDGRVCVLSMLRDLRREGETPAEPPADRESYRALIQAAAEGIYRSLPNGGFIDVNPAMAAIFGYATPAQMLIDVRGAASQLYVDSAHREWLYHQLERAGRFDRVHSEVRRRDGSTIWISENSREVRDANGTLLFYEGTVIDITETLAAEHAREQAERRFRDLFERSPAGLFRTTLRGEIVDANPEFARILGYDSVEELKHERTNITAIYAQPDDRAHLVERVLAEGGLDGHEMYVLARDGQQIWVSASVRVIRPDHDAEPMFAGSLLDMSARRRAEDALKRSESKYRTLVEHSQVGVFIAHGERYVYANHRLCEMFGYSEGELLSLTLRDRVAPEYLPAEHERLQRMQAGEVLPPDFESCYLCKGGSRIYVTVSLGPMELDGERYSTGTVRDITRHREAEQRLRFHATHDPLTGLPNRMMFQRQLDDVLREARASDNYDYAVLFLDLDGFKLVNDSLGHAAGDRLLVVIGELLTRTLNEEALVARYGGDEFTLLPSGRCDQARALQLAARVLDLFGAPFDIDSHQVFSGASLGIVLGHEDYTKPDQVLRDADTAMYRAKARGKSGYVVFDEAMHAAAKLRFQIENDLRLALERGEFRVHYQPVMGLRDGALHGFEALVRWQHPARGLMYPAEFLHVAEESGLIAQLDWWVLEETCRQLSAWQRRYPAHSAMRVSVNVDERQIGAADTCGRLQRLLQRTGIAPERITLEITESVFRDGRGPAAPTLEALKALGVGLAVDDFGTGYSSLESFASAPFDLLKIDRSFIRDLETNTRHRAIVRTICGFAEDLGLALTAEGVENAAQARVLTAMGCQSAQGFLYAPALAPEDAETLLANGRALRRASA